MASEEAVPYAFLEFAAEDAVLMRGNTLIEGKEAIQAYFMKSTLDSVQLLWSPDIVTTSKSSDLGYTHGKYKFPAVDFSGRAIKAEGIFRT